MDFTLRLPAVLVFCMLTVTVFGYPNGAPTTVCSSMTPGHGTETTDDNPYSVSASVSQYTAGQSLTVTINGTPFKGLLLQARVKDSTTVVGSFSNFPADTKGIMCTIADGAVTHSSTTDKAAGTSFTWTAPSDLDSEIEFVATVNAEKLTWWTQTKSSSLTKADGSQMTTSSTNTGDQTSSVSISSSSSTTTTAASAGPPTSAGTGVSSSQSTVSSSSSSGTGSTSSGVTTPAPGVVTVTMSTADEMGNSTDNINSNTPAAEGGASTTAPLSNWVTIGLLQVATVLSLAYQVYAQ